MEFMSQIETVVVLMLENRSLDNVLGWLYEHDQPHRFVPDEPPYEFRGLKHDLENRTVGRGVNGPVTWTYRPTKGTTGFAQPMRTPRSDPWEGMLHVQRQMYGNDEAQLPVGAEPWGPHAPMTGFAADYPAPADSSGEVMGGYSTEQLPVLSGLARHFAVSDAWFSSVPTETDPNRAFSICGTSLGRTGDLPLTPFDAPTIFNGLDNAGVSWGIYWQYRKLLDLDLDLLDRRCWTADRFPHIKRSLDDGFGRVEHYHRFLTQLRNREPIPQFCYVEPYWGWGVGRADSDDFVGLQGNDYHPPTWVGPAETDLSELYEALIHSPQWDNMLFVISFDEHGGTYDHVPPPAAQPPDEHVGQYGDGQIFRFDRLGPRVPTILVSPFVQPGTVFRPPKDATAAFDHTSVISTVLAWAGTDPKFVAQLGQRVACAPTFESALTDQPWKSKPTLNPPVEAPGTAPRKGPHGFPFDIGQISWDDLKALSAEVDGDAPLTADDVVAALRRRLIT